MRKTSLLICFFAWLSGLPDARGQSIGPSTINASGGSGTIGTNKYDWSIGEMTLVSTFTGSSVIVTQGVLQNNKTATSVPGISIGDRLQVFPNPASTILNLQFTSTAYGSLRYRFMDMTGRVIITRSITVAQGITKEQLDIAAFAAATYMLEVSVRTADGAEETTSFKIDKLQ